MVSPTSIAKEKYLDEKWDWRQKEVLNDDPPEQRGNTSWAYASVAAVEANLQIHKKINEKLSVQELIDCCYLQGGIKKRVVTSAAQTLGYIRDKGITTTTEYPTLLPPDAAYGVCKRCVNQLPPKVKITKLTVMGVEDLSVRALMNAVKERPVIVSFWAGKKFTEYKKEDNIVGQGFFADKLALSKSFFVAHDPELEDVDNHYALIVGYDTEKGRDGEPGEGYWILRNSYGTSWGDNGYMKLHRDFTSMFTLALYPEDAHLVAAP